MGLIATVIGGLFPRASTPGASDDFWYNDVSRGNSANVKVTPTTALQASALFTCVSFLAKTIASLPLRVFRETDAGRELTNDHPIGPLLRFQPNTWHTAVEFWETMVFHSVLRGRAYAEIIPGGQGAIGQLQPLHPDQVKVRKVGDNDFNFEVRDREGARPRILLREELFRVSGLMTNGIEGLETLGLAREAVALALAADSYAARVFSNRLNIGGFLIHPRKLSEDAHDNFVKALTRRFANVWNAHRPMVLQEGMKFERASMDLDKAQLLEARKHQALEIARYFHIPPQVVGILDDVNRSTAEQQAIELVKYTIRPLVKRFEQAIRRDLLLPGDDVVVKWILEGLLRGDSKARAEFYAKAIQWGWMTRNEVRERENLNQMEGLDDPLTPLNMFVGADPTSEAEAADGRPAQVSTTRQQAEALVRKEVAAIRKAAMRLASDPDAFRRWVQGFYGGHVSWVMEVLRIPKDAAKAYCSHQRQEVLAANDVEGLMTRWEDGLAGQIASTIEARAA